MAYPMSRDSLEILGSKKTTDTSDRRRNDTLERQGNRKNSRKRKKRCKKTQRERAMILFRSRRNDRASKARNRRRHRKQFNSKLTCLIRQKEKIVKNERKSKNKKTSRRNTEYRRVHSNIRRWNRHCCCNDWGLNMPFNSKKLEKMSFY